MAEFVINKSREEAKEYIWKSQSIIDCPEYYKKLYPPSITDSDFEEILKSHEKFFEDKDGKRIEELISKDADLKVYFEHDVTKAKQGSAESCKIIAAYLYKNKRYESCLNWLSIAFERGASEVIVTINDVKQLIKTLV